MTRIAVTRRTPPEKSLRSFYVSVREVAYRGWDYPKIAREELQSLLDSAKIKMAGEYIVSITGPELAWADLFTVEVGGLRIA